MTMNQLNYTLLVGAISIVVGILLCLAILIALGKLQLGETFHKSSSNMKEGKTLGDIDYRRLRDIYGLISKLTATLKVSKGY